MEGQVLPAPPASHQQGHPNTSNKEDQEEEFDDYYDINDLKDDNNQKMQIISSKSQPYATYIIQFPKNQIYRVPPPENAEIIERYRNSMQTNQSEHRQCVYWFLSILFVVAFFVSVMVCVHHFTLKPMYPNFSIKHFTIRHPPSSKKNASPQFQVSMETSNPNNVNNIGYAQGSATLTYKGKKIGLGSVPALENEKSGKSDTMNVIITSKGSLPKELQSQSNKSKKSKAINLNMSIIIPLNLKTWLYTKKVKVNVGCDFEIDSVIGDHIKVLSQNCDIQ